MRDSRRRNHVGGPGLHDVSAGVVAERWKTEELTDGGSVRGGDEEDANEKLGDEHGFVDLQLGGRCPRKKSVLGFISVLSFPASTRSPPYPICCLPFAGLPPSSLCFHSSSSRLAGNPISSRNFHCPGAFVGIEY
jgi:hypothetical protein